MISIQAHLAKDQSKISRAKLTLVHFHSTNPSLVRAYPQNATLRINLIF